MTDNRNRLRSKQIEFFVNDEECNLIKQKMALYGAENMSVYLRKLAIDGYVLKLDLSELKELISLMRRISNNENQITKSSTPPTEFTIPSLKKSRKPSGDLRRNQ